MLSPCSHVGLQQLFFRLFLLPTFFFLLWNFYYGLEVSVSSRSMVVSVSMYSPARLIDGTPSSSLSSGRSKVVVVCYSTAWPEQPSYLPQLLLKPVSVETSIDITSSFCFMSKCSFYFIIHKLIFLQRRRKRKKNRWWW